MPRRPFLACLLLALFAAPAHSQSPVSFSLAGGVSLPQGRFADGASTGWHALASIGLNGLMQPIGLRVDAAHSRFTAKAAGPDQAVTSATLNLAYRLPMTDSPFSPYLITGAGAYRLECYGTVDCPPTTRFGWNAGLGVKFFGLGLKGFAESRFHAMNARPGNVRYVPVTVALTF